jgi:hypothetical protein
VDNAATSVKLAWPGWRILSILMVAALLMAPALWNGYPLIYYDTEDYVEISFNWQPILWRIMTYGGFAWIGQPFGTLWAVAWAQALVAAWMLHEAVWCWIARYRPQVYAALGLVLAVLTGLPWVTSQILADVFSGLSILGVAVLAFGDGLPRWRRLALVPLVALAISQHMSHVAVTSGMVLVLVVLRLISPLSLRMPRPRLLFPAVAVALGVLTVPAVHWLATGRAFFSESGAVLQLALFVQDGLAKKYLDEVCPQGAAFKMCEHKEELPYTADEFLWGASPFGEMGGWTGLHDEAGAIVKGAARMFPLETAEAMLGNMATQLDLIASGEDLVPMSWHFVKTEMKRYPRDFKAFRFSRQNRPEGIDFTLLNQIQVPVAQAAQAALLVFLVVAWRRRDRVSAGLLTIVIVAILGNAFVCGALSNPHDRYQNRIIWLALFASSIAAIRLDQRFTRKRPDQVSSQP